MIEKKGYYDGTVTEAVLAESKANGTPSLKLAIDVPDEGTAYYDAWLTERAAERTIENLIEVFDFNGDFGDVEQFLGKPCNIKVASEDYEGKTVYKVVYVNKIGGGGPKALDGDKARSLTAKLKQRTAAIVRHHRKANVPVR